MRLRACRSHMTKRETLKPDASGKCRLRLFLRNNPNKDNLRVYTYGRIGYRAGRRFKTDLALRSLQWSDGWGWCKEEGLFSLTMDKQRQGTERLENLSMSLRGPHRRDPRRDRFTLSRTRDDLSTNMTLPAPHPHRSPPVFDRIGECQVLASNGSPDPLRPRKLLLL
jgi:hypothetical protein